MVEIRYGEHYEVADLAGQLVAEARERYKEEFGIPDKAQAKLNGKRVRRAFERRMRLFNGDKLSFGEKAPRKEGYCPG